MRKHNKRKNISGRVREGKAGKGREGEGKGGTINIHF